MAEIGNPSIKDSYENISSLFIDVSRRYNEKFPNTLIGSLLTALAENVSQMVNKKGYQSLIYTKNDYEHLYQILVTVNQAMNNNLSSHNPIISELQNIIIDAYSILLEYEILGGAVGGLDYIRTMLVKNNFADYPELYTALNLVQINKSLKIISEHNKKDDFNKIKIELDSWESSYEARWARASELLDYVKNISENLSFVGLVKAFSDLLCQKDKEINEARSNMLLCGMFMVLIPMFNMGMIWFSKRVDFQSLAYLAPASITLLFILIYFFRVLLADYKSLLVQKTQLQIRRALCQFIQEYVNFTNENHNSYRSLEAFEKIIFGSLVLDEGKIPSTFDGMEQLAKIIESVKGK